MVTFPNAVTRIAFAGDWHGNLRYALKAMYYAIKNGAEVIIQVGDFGYWNDGGYLDALQDMCERHQVILMFVDGNHENHPLLNAQPLDDDGVRRLRPRVWHLPRGFRWSWMDATFMALGGAYSVDKPARRQGIDWFPEETITLAQAYEAVQDGAVDVLLAHDCPDGVDIPGISKTPDFFPADQIELAQRHRALLRQIVDEVTPRFIWHGHYHRAYLNKLDLDGTICQVRGLDKDGSPLSDNVNIVDVHTLTPWWVE